MAQENGTSTRTSTGIPKSFKVDEHGLSFAKYHDGEVEWIRIGDPLEISALTRSESGGDWGRLLRWRDSDGRPHEWALPMAMLAGDGIGYREHLLGNGFRIEPNHGARTGLQSYISSCTPSARAIAVTRLGWHGERFILPDRVFGDSANGEATIFQPLQPIEHAFYEAGTLGEWRENVAAPCVGNSRLIFAVSMAFAPSLLEMLGEESGGVNLVGHSSVGKTTALNVAGSVWGGGRFGFKRSWRATINGLESVAAAHSDGFLGLDELGQADPRAVAEAAYLFANGQGKARARRDGSGRPPASWRLLFLSTGEVSLATKITEAAFGRTMAGQAVRVLDIPADAGSGFGLFEDLHGAKDGDVFARRLNEAAASYYGTPIRKYLEELTDDPGGNAAWVETVKCRFIAELKIQGSDGQVQRAAGRFALIAAAGELSRELGITGWEEGAACEAAEKCFRAWLAMRGGTGPLELAAGVGQVRKFIEEHGESRFAPWNEDPNRPTIHRAGFRRRPGPDAPWEYYILTQTFREEVCRGYDMTALARELVRRNILVPSPDGTLSRSVRIPAIGEKTTRVYHITSAIFDNEE
jgi:putative DNA primase/helicase